MRSNHKGRLDSLNNVNTMCVSIINDLPSTVHTRLSFSNSNNVEGMICYQTSHPTSEIVSIAKDADYDSLFIELEHSSFSLSQASQLFAAGITSGITPLVRVPHQCGNGFVQRVLDGGAMGVIFPHISSVGKFLFSSFFILFPLNCEAIGAKC